MYRITGIFLRLVSLKPCRAKDITSAQLSSTIPLTIRRSSQKKHLVQLCQHCDGRMRTTLYVELMTPSLAWELVFGAATWLMRRRSALVYNVAQSGSILTVNQAR